MKKKKIKSIKANTLSIMLFMSIALNAQTDVKQNFISAKNEIESMLSDKTALDYEKAVFITENAYHNNTLDFKEYKSFIDSYTRLTLKIAKNLSFKRNEIKRNHLISSDSVASNIYRASVNYSIYKIITDTCLLKIDDGLFSTKPFSYSYTDPLASKNWCYSQLSNLYLDKTQQGNCNALTTLFKILSLRLNSNANLNTTQGHIFITHADANGIFYNIELASKAFPGTGSIETITHTSDEAARNGIAMRELNLKQSIGLCLLNLAKSYQHKFNIKDDAFILDCAEQILKYDSKNLNAMLLKAEVLEERIVKQNLPFNKIKITSEFLIYQNYIVNLHKLGYREMPTEMKNQVIAAITKDTSYISLYKDKTLYPFLNIDKNNKRSASLSNGMFEETDIDKPQEKYFRTVFDTKSKKIIAFNPPEKLYKDYIFDPVVFAWQIDPLFKKYPNMSPYSAFANNPILFIDTDGQEFITYVKLKDAETGKLIMHKVTFDGTNITAQNAKTGANANYNSGDSKFVDNIVSSYNYIVTNGADVDNAMQQMAKSSIQVQIIEEKKAAEYTAEGTIEYDFNYGLEVFDEKGNSLGNQSSALGFWSEVYHGYIDKIDNAAKEQYSQEKSQENYVHLQKEPQVIDKLKAKDANNSEAKRKTYNMDGGDAWPVKTESAISTKKEEE